MTLESLPGSVTAPDPLEVENDALRAERDELRSKFEAEQYAFDTQLRETVALRAEVERLKRTVEVCEAALPFWPFQMREFIRTGDVEGMKREAARREAWVKDVHTEMHAGRITIATLTAERDSLRTRIENAEAGSVVARAVIDSLAAERDALREQLADAEELKVRHVEAALVSGAEEEREACAELATTMLATVPLSPSGIDRLRERIAAAIRARGGKP